MLAYTLDYLFNKNKIPKNEKIIRQYHKIKILSKQQKTGREKKSF